MNIKSSVYESLTPRQRVIATIEAEARGDDDEVHRLVDTCPKFTFRQNDTEYSYTMVRLIALKLAIESDIRGYVIGALLSIIVEHNDALQVFLQDIANTNAAWNETMEVLGIDPASMKKFAPEPDAAVLTIRKNMQDFLG